MQIRHFQKQTLTEAVLSVRGYLIGGKTLLRANRRGLNKIGPLPECVPLAFCDVIAAVCSASRTIARAQGQEIERANAFGLRLKNSSRASCLHISSILEIFCLLTGDPKSHLCCGRNRLERGPHFSLV